MQMPPLYRIWRFTNRNYQTTAIYETNYWSSSPLLPSPFFPFRFQLEERCGTRPGSRAAGTRGNCYYFRWNCATSVSLARHPARKENSHSRHLRLLFLRPSLQLTFKTNAGCLFAVEEPRSGCTHEYARHGETSKKRRFERSIWIYHLRYFKFYITTTNCHSIVRRITNENFLIFQYEVEKKKLKISWSKFVQIIEKSVRLKSCFISPRYLNRLPRYKRSKSIALRKSISDKKLLEWTRWFIYFSWKCVLCFSKNPCVYHLCL